MPMARTRNQPSPISGAPRVPMEGPEPRGGAPVVGAVMGAGARGGERTTISRHPGRRRRYRRLENERPAAEVQAVAAVGEKERPEAKGRRRRRLAAWGAGGGRWGRAARRGKQREDKEERERRTGRVRG